MRLLRALSICFFLFVGRVPLSQAQEARFSGSDSRDHDWPMTSAVPRSLAHAARDTLGAHGTHRRATIIGATTGAVIGGLGTAAFILNALAPDCITLVSTASSSHCGHRGRIVALETVTIAGGASVGAFGGAWVGRRIASWRHDRHHDPRPNTR